jgi:hypothetical protein
MSENEDEANICEVCRQKIDMDAPDTVRAYLLIDASSYGPPGRTPGVPARPGEDKIEGRGLLFHRDHYFDNPRWRRESSR